MDLPTCQIPPGFAAGSVVYETGRTIFRSQRHIRVSNPDILVVCPPRRISVSPGADTLSSTRWIVRYGSLTVPVPLRSSPMGDTIVRSQNDRGTDKEIEGHEKGHNKFVFLLLHTNEYFLNLQD